jgi:ABC-type Zn2+ transport system substrate-binding protein/surface adhesin
VKAVRHDRGEPSREHLRQPVQIDVMPPDSAQPHLAARTDSPLRNVWYGPARASAHATAETLGRRCSQKRSQLYQNLPSFGGKLLLYAEEIDTAILRAIWELPQALRTWP